MNTVAIVKTDFGDAYMKRLCRHFSHKIPTSVEGRQGRIEFPFGACRIDVDDGQMQFHVAVTDPRNLDRAERVIADHLIRMANRDEPEVTWNRSTPAPE